MKVTAKTEDYHDVEAAVWWFTKYDNGVTEEILGSFDSTRGRNEPYITRCAYVNGCDIMVITYHEGVFEVAFDGGFFRALSFMWNTL